MISDSVVRRASSRILASVLALFVLAAPYAYAQTNTPPTVNITSPGDGSSFALGGNISFAGSATDTEDGTLTGSLDWTSSIDGAIGAGGSFSTSSLSTGTHTITATVTDSGGLPGSDAISITITNDSPSVTISSPTNGSSFALGDNISFTGSATDTEDGTLTGSLDWTSSIDGGIGSGGSFSTSGLTAGTHTITAAVTDSNSNLGSDAITVTITNNAPTVNITSPTDGASFALGDNISFQADGSDVEDNNGQITNSISWTSSINGSIGSGGNVNSSALSAGNHTITASVTDSNGNPGSDSVSITVTNSTPTVNITQPSNDSSFAFGTNITFVATATDAEDGNLASSISWASNVDGALGTGGSINVNDLSVGSHTITASVTDSNSNPGLDSIAVTITNNAPTVTITSPSNGASFAAGTNINLVATATDAEDGNLASSVNWTSSLDSALGTGGSISVNDLSIGNHTITASVTDSDDGSGSDSINITITNNAPTVTITSPSNGASFAAGTNISFVATAADAEDGNLASSVDWTSSIDGALGTGGSISVNDLSIGNHTITASVTDSDNGSGSDSISITIANNAPTVTITSPANGASFTAGTNITFVATATDAEDGNLASSIDWTSSIDGALGTGGSISVNDLSIGNHTITASATDSDDGSGSDSISISITNTAPIADDQNVSTDEDVALPIVLTGSDAEDDPLTYTFNQPSNGVVTGTGPNVTYTPNPNFNGADSFTFTVNDGQLTSDPATVAIDVIPVNDAPVATNDTPPAIDEGRSNNEDPPFNVLTNDSDVDGDTLTVVIVAEPVNAASFVLNPDGTFTYEHDGSETTADSFTYQVDDGGANNNLSNVATVSITINSVNDYPVVEQPIAADCVADPALCKAIEDSPFELDVRDNFSDADGDTLTFSAQGLPASGRLTIDPDNGIISGTPRQEDARDNEPYIVIVQASDGVAGSVAAEDQFELSVSARDRADLALAISLASPTALPGEQVNWTFSGLNVGPEDGISVVLDGSFLGTGISVIPPGASGCTITNLTDQVDFSCPIGTLPNGATTDLVFQVSASQPTELVGFATLAGSQPDPIDPVIRDNSAFAGVGVADSLSAGAVQLLDDNASSSPIRVLSVTAGSVNSLTDAANDLVVGTAAGEPVRVFLNDAPRETCQCLRDFQVGISVPDLASNRGVALADFDGDTILDLVVANGNMQPTRVWKNDGTGSFSLMVELAAANANDVAVGDFDNDGSMDVVVAASSPNLVYFGDGNGGFSAPVLLQQDVVEGESSFGVAVGNFDGVNGDDIVFANVGAESQVWVGTGGGAFELRDMLPIGDAVSVAAANLDGLGVDDIVFGRVSGGPGDVPANPVLINPGNGDFGVPVATLGRSATNDVLVGDIDGVAPLDIVVISATGVHQIWMSSGGGYVLHAEQIFDPGVVDGVVIDLGDTDAGIPGGADMAIGGAPGAGLGVYLNDAAGNLGRGDPVPPVITLNGGTAVNVPSGSAYTDAGATADDNIDGDISASIVVDNPVNVAVVGAYTVTYNVQDFAGNPAAPVTRTVNVTAATGRGGGGGAFGIWAITVLIGVHLAATARRKGQMI